MELKKTGFVRYFVINPVLINIPINEPFTNPYLPFMHLGLVIKLNYAGIWTTLTSQLLPMLRVLAWITNFLG